MIWSPGDKGDKGEIGVAEHQFLQGALVSVAANQVGFATATVAAPFSLGLVVVQTGEGRRTGDLLRFGALTVSAALRAVRTAIEFSNAITRTTSERGDQALSESGLPGALR